jgi:hypothetical protein
LAPIAKGYSGASQRIFDTGSRPGGTVSVSSPTQDISSLKPPAYAWGFLSFAAPALYPVALRPSEYDMPNPNALLGYGSAHPIMRTFFERAYRELERRVPEEIARFEKAGVFR